MPTHSCTSCGRTLTDSAQPCPHCGAVPHASATAPAAPSGATVEMVPRTKLVYWLIGLPVGAFALLMAVGWLLSTPEGNNQWVAREAVRVCNKEIARAPEDRKRADLTPADCAALEAAFRAQYGTPP